MATRNYHSFIRARLDHGISLAQARQDYRTVKNEGYAAPGKWHGQRVDYLKERSYVKERTQAGVAKEQARSEARKAREQGLPIGRKEAKEKRYEPPGGGGGGGRSGPKTLSEYLRYCEDYNDYPDDWEYVEFITSGGGSTGG